MPNIPVSGWLSMKSTTDTGDTISCSKYPALTDLLYRNKYWQIFKFLDRRNRHSNETLDVTFHLYGAYFDNRTMLTSPVIRIISMVHSRFDNSIPLKNSTVMSNFPETSLREVIKIFLMINVKPTLLTPLLFEMIKITNFKHCH